ncbi:fatty-acid amide hydrolase 1-like [Pleurodeles waltl]|uniref:fatty-acid amide hydrolase 1-like n=1 Tax=Pleurodeles waltl TaxID=8319 RepID=UPI0037097705
MVGLAQTEEEEQRSSLQPVDSEEEEAEGEDVDNRSNIIQQYFQWHTDASTNTHLFNVLNFPAGVVPVTIVTEDDEEQLKQYKGHYNDHWDNLLKQAARGGVGLPVAVQCVALPWQEELCLRLMKEVEQVTHHRRRRCSL